MSQLRSLKLAYAIPLVALSSLAVARRQARKPTAGRSGDRWVEAGPAGAGSRAVSPRPQHERGRPGRLSRSGVPAGQHRAPVAVEQRERPSRPWPRQRAVKLPRPCLLLVGPLHRYGRTPDRFVPSELVPPQRFRAPMPQCDGRLERYGRTYAGASRRACRHSVAAFAGSP